MKSLFDTFNAPEDAESNLVREQLKGFLTPQSSAEFVARDATSITLATVREGSSPYILIINGYLSEEGEVVSDWLSVVDELYPENKIIHVRWNAGDIIDIARNGDTISDENAVDKWFAAAKLARDMSPAGIAALVGGIVADKLVGHWHKSFNETLHAGLDLANAVQGDKQLHGAILMGYSLGAKVACQALKNLDANTVSRCYLLAGAVSADAEQWAPILAKHSELKLINCYSDNDDVLKGANGAEGIFSHTPAGLTKIESDNAKQVVNLDVSAFSSGHMHFKNERVGKVLASFTFNNSYTDYVVTGEVRALV
ncbi:DUF726 domain-containing protein [Moritella sp. F3]|uniref:DUF726 domain-containing protein n=1 Tax=Moritella sp. F3 TaxID=2718882 RepID=UPI0018E18078|nr:DUF726 domain-containing protein [Moritella sp. F3]GIC79201.1 hypothetical protein FMO001_39280 [Moritella sp. F1]GIC81111.1 hypothetical protein FMO003_13920 [Moritella sp. F3]